MPANREMTMRQMRQVLRLHASGTSDREIGRTVGAARSTVRDAIKRAKAAGLAWPLPEDLTDAALEETLFAREFGVSREAVRNAVEGLTFKYLPMPPKRLR